MKKHKHQLIICLLLAAHGNEIWNLPTPVEVKLPGDQVYVIHRAGVSPDFELWLGDGGGNWAPLEAGDLNCDKMLDALFPTASQAHKHLKEKEVA